MGWIDHEEFNGEVDFEIEWSRDELSRDEGLKIP